jgi:uncharacterized protein
MDNPIIWFEIYVQDMPRAKKFYESVLQVKLEKVPGPDIEMWGFPSNPKQWGASGTLVKVEGMPSGGNSTLVYFACEDCAVEEARVAKAGGRIHRKKISIGPYGFVSLVFDTEGNMVGLHSMQ